MSDDNTTAPDQVAETTTPATTAPAAEAPKGTVPYARFSEKVAEVGLWKQQVEDLRKQVAEVETWKTKATDLETQFSQARSAWDEEKAFTSAGLTDAEAMDVARMFYGKVPADARPEGGIGAWLADLRADPTKAPKALAAYLPAVETAAPPDSQAKPIPNARPPASVGTGRPAPATGAVTADAIRAAVERAQRSGLPEDWATYATLKKSWEAAAAKR